MITKRINYENIEDILKSNEINYGIIDSVFDKIICSPNGGKFLIAQAKEAGTSTDDNLEIYFSDEEEKEDIVKEK